MAGSGGRREGGSAFAAGVCEVEAVDPFELGSLSSAMTRPASDFDDALLRQISRPRGDPLLSDIEDNEAESTSRSWAPSTGRTSLGVRGRDRDGSFKGGGGGNESMIV